MRLDLTRFGDTPEAGSRLFEHLEDGRAAAHRSIESVRGELRRLWYAFGGRDGFNLWVSPDDVSVAATAIAIRGGLALSSFGAAARLTLEQMLVGFQKASAIDGRPPEVEA
jgi:hypothetical protein